MNEYLWSTMHDLIKEMTPDSLDHSLGIENDPITGGGGGEQEVEKERLQKLHGCERLP